MRILFWPTKVWVTLLLSSAALSLQVQAEETDVIFDNSIAAPVDSVPLKPIRFTLYDARTITSIQTFHWNGGQGATPGSIALQGKDKRLFGPWKATGVADDQGLNNAYWLVQPNTLLEAGTYTVLDSEPGTWARNPAQGNVGIVRITGQQQNLSAAETATTTQPIELIPPAESAGESVASADITPLTHEQQQLRAEELFEQIRQTDNYDYEQIERLYLQLLRECPDSDKAEESYFRLSNLYRMGMDPPEYGKLRVLLEEYLERFPDSDMAPEMRERLLRTYESSGQWQQVVEIYDQLIPALPEDHQYYLVKLLDYANALEGNGNREKAFTYYQQVASIAGGEKAGNYDMSDFWLRVAQNRIDVIGKIQAEQWQDLVSLYREQFSKMAWAEMPQIQELLEYAEALEKSGDAPEAINQYRKVLKTDQGYETRQAQLARERLVALGS